MIRFHISSIRNYGVVLKLERFSHLSYRSFGLGLDTYHWCFHSESVRNEKGIPNVRSESYLE